MKGIIQSGKGMIGVIAMAMLLAVSVPAWAQPQMSREGNAWAQTDSGTLPSARDLRVAVDVGTVTIETGGTGLRYTVKARFYTGNEQEARRQFDDLRISAAKDGNAAVLRLTGGYMKHGRSQVEIVVSVPQDMDSIRVESKAGNINVGSTSARVGLRTMGGNISVAGSGDLATDTYGGNTTVQNVNGNAALHSMGGNVSVGTVKGKLVLDTQGGNVDVNSIESGGINTGGGCVSLMHSNGDVTVNTGGGTIQIGDVNGAAKAETGGGNIRIGMAKGPVTATTGGGNVELWKMYSGAQVSTGAGAITVQFLGGKNGFSDSYLRTSAGDVVVYLSNAFSGSVRASSEMASGSGISTDFPELHVTSAGGDWGPKTMTAEGSFNGGGPLLKVRTTIGQIAFRKSK